MEDYYSYLVKEASSSNLPFLEEEEERIAKIVNSPMVKRPGHTPEPVNEDDKDVMLRFLVGDAAPHIQGALNALRSNSQVNKAASLGLLGLGTLLLRRL